jgi:hypothetical protein
MTLLHRPTTSLNMFAVLTALSVTACSDDPDPASDDSVETGKSEQAPTGDASAESPENKPGPLVILTERASTDGNVHYLHVVEDWPESGELDYDKAVELGPPGVMKVGGSSIYFYQGATGAIDRFTVDAELNIKRGAKLSFSAYGIKDFDPEPIWVSNELAFMLDEKTAQIVRFNPSAMKIEGADDIREDVLERVGAKVQFQLGIPAGERLFTTTSWHNWTTNEVYTATVLGVFDQADTSNGPRLVEDDRCAASVGIGPFVDGDHIYAVGDGATGFDILANPKKSKNPQCVVRMPIDGDAFEEDYFIDLQEVTGSPAIYMAYPMVGHKLLVSMWNPDVEVSVAKKDAKDAAWFWEGPPYYQYAIIDLETKEVQKIEGLPDAAMRSPKVLIVDERNFVQTFREDKGSDVHRIDPDGTVTQVLTNETSTNVQFVGRLP